MTTTRATTFTRRAALTLAGSFGAGVLAACSKDEKKSGTTGTAQLPGPERIRAEAKAMEPASYVKTYTVDASGKGGAYKTFGEAYKAIAADRMARIGTPMPSQSNLWDWRLIKVMPGTYHECIVAIPPHTAIVGQGARPEDVRIWWDGNENTFESTGRSTYVRNVHLDHTNDNPDLHAMRDNGPAGDVDMKGRQRRTVVFDNVRFTSPRNASLGKCTNDMAPRGGVSLTFHKCTFEGPGQPQSINLITNQGGQGDAAEIAFIGCSIVSNYEQHPDKSRGQLGLVGAAPFGAPDFSHGRKDRLLWMDGRWDVGKVGGVQALLVFPYIADKGQTGNDKPVPSTEYILVAPGSVAGMKTLKQEKTKPATSTVPGDFHLPAHGVSAMEARFFGRKPSTSGQIFQPSGASAGTMSVKAGDVYWIKVPHPDAAVCASAVTVDGLSAGAFAAYLTIADEDGKPLYDGNASTGAAPGKPGALTVPSRWFYPGQGDVWVGVGFTNDATVPAVRCVQGAALKGGGFKGAGQGVPQPDGVTAVSAGQPIPKIGLQSKLPAAMA